MSDIDPTSGFDLKQTRIHGHRVAYRHCGEGPAIVLVHGITARSWTWRYVAPSLAERYTVLAPDMLGHGESAKPRGDYSLGAYASGVRDLMTVLGIERATFVGHSLGGGVAMQLAYQFPERCERLVLVSSGGLGREVSPLLRAATLPGSEIVLPLLASSGLLELGRRVGSALSAIGLRPGTDVEEIARGHASLHDAEARAAFLHTLRSIIDPGGQRVDARDRLYLAEHVPTMLVWGEKDSVIPVKHGYEAQDLVPGSRLEVFEKAGHHPHLDEPARFADLLAEFIDGTDAADMAPERWQELLAVGGTAPSSLAASA
jgi:pimeloyl-ACP methyl ester carboxylesterase